jgi:hypothetical protein
LVRNVAGVVRSRQRSQTFATAASHGLTQQQRRMLLKRSSVA